MIWTSKLYSDLPFAQRGLWSVERPVDRQAPTVKNMIVGRSTGQSIDRPFLAPSDPQRLIFLSLYIYRVIG